MKLNDIKIQTSYVSKDYKYYIKQMMLYYCDPDDPEFENLLLAYKSLDSIDKIIAKFYDNHVQ